MKWEGWTNNAPTKMLIRKTDKHPNWHDAVGGSRHECTQKNGGACEKGERNVARGVTDDSTRNEQTADLLTLLNTPTRSSQLCMCLISFVAFCLTPRPSMAPATAVSLCSPLPFRVSQATSGSPGAEPKRSRGKQKDQRGGGSTASMSECVCVWGQA